MDERQYLRINFWHQIQLAGENLRQEHSRVGLAQRLQPGFEVLQRERQTFPLKSRLIFCECIPLPVVITGIHIRTYFRDSSALLLERQTHLYTSEPRQKTVGELRGLFIQI